METIRVGLLIPHTDTTLELDLHRSLGKCYSIHSERMWLEDVTIESEQQMLDEELPRAIDYLDGLNLDVCIFGCTSAGAIHGLSGDEKVKQMISERLNCPVISAYSAVYRMLQRRHSDRVSIMTPYIESVTDRVVTSLKENGIQVEESVGMGLTQDHETGALTPDEICSFIANYDSLWKGMDTLFISCTNMRALECKETIQQTYPIHVVTSNDAIIQSLHEMEL